MRRRKREASALSWKKYIQNIMEDRGLGNRDWNDRRLLRDENDRWQSYDEINKREKRFQNQYSSSNLKACNKVFPNFLC